MAKLKLVERETANTVGSKQPFNPHRLEAPYAYYTENGELKAWSQDQIVNDSEEIQHLKERGARLIELKP